MDDEVKPLAGELATTNYGWLKPNVGNTDDAWGSMLNGDLDSIDSTVKSVSNAATAAQTTANAALPVAGGTMTGPIVLAADPAAPLQPATKQYADTKLAKLGVTDGSDAAAGQIGEVISSITGSAVSVPNATAVNLTSIALTAGDWDVQGEAVIAVGTGGATLIAAAINSVSAAMPAVPTPMGAARAQITASLTASANQALALSPCRISASAGTTMYLIAVANYPSGSTTAQGKIWARRAR